MRIKKVEVKGPAPPVPGKGRVVAGVNTTLREERKARMGGYINLDTINRFRYYQQLSALTSHVSISLHKLGLSLIKNAQFQGTSSRTVKNFEAWSRKTKFTEQLQTIGRLLPRDGIYLAEPLGKDPDKFKMKPFLMPYTSILGEGVQPGGTPIEIMQPEISYILVNEGMQNKQTYKPENVVYGTFAAWDSVQLDIKQRETFGIYGSSLMEPITLSIQNLLGINAGYVSFVRKYGMGRYLFDFELLQKLVEAGIMTYKEAQAAIDEFDEKHKNLGENEDISALGLKINQVDAKGSLDIQNFKNSLETEIQVGLLQSPLVMGKSAGSTYASAYLAEEDRFLVMEGLQRTVEDIANEIINRRLKIMGAPQDSVEIEFEKLSRVKLTASEVQEMFNTGVISKYQYQFWAGFADEDDDTGSE